jgi:tRNA modification GTPase
VLSIRTKADLVADSDQSQADVLWTSAQTGDGLASLISAIDRTIDERHPFSADTPMLTRARHRRAIEIACSETREFERAWKDEKLPATVAAVHLRTAVVALEELVGSIEIEDVLDRVFSSFCVGK